MSNEQHNELIEFRLAKLEEAISSLSVIKDTVLKWDSKFTSSDANFLQCPLHAERLTRLDGRLSSVEIGMDKLKSWNNKSMGALIIISILIQILGPIVANSLKIQQVNDNPPQVTQSAGRG